MGFERATVHQFLHSKAIKFIYSKEKYKKKFDLSNALSPRLHLISRSVIKLCHQAKFTDASVHSEELQLDENNFFYPIPNF